MLLKTTRSLSLFAVSLLAVVAAGGCAEKIVVTYPRPAEINMAGYEQVTIGDISGAGGDMVAAKLQSQLLAANFAVLDRSALSQRQRELDIATRQGNNSAESGSNRGITRAVARITGKMLRNNCGQSVESQTSSSGVVYRVSATAEVEVSLQITDLDTTRVLASKSIEATQSAQSKWTSTPEGGLAQEPLYAAAYDKVVNKFMRTIAPYMEQVELELDKVSESPANDSGIQLMKINEYAQAASQFNSAIAAEKAKPKASPGNVAKLTYNLATAIEFSGELTRARELYKSVVASGAVSSGKYIESLRRCEQRIADTGKLREQGVTSNDR